MHYIVMYVNAKTSVWPVWLVINELPMQGNEVIIQQRLVSCWMGYSPIE